MKHKDMCKLLCQLSQVLYITPYKCSIVTSLAEYRYRLRLDLLPTGISILPFWLEKDILSPFNHIASNYAELNTRWVALGL